MSIAGYVPSKKPVINFDFVNGEYHGGPVYGISDTSATVVNKNGEVRKIDYWNSNGAGTNAGGLWASFYNGHRIDYDPYTGECKGLLLETTSTNRIQQHNGTLSGNYKQTSQGLTICGPDGNDNSAREFTVNSDSNTGGSTHIWAAGTAMGLTSSTSAISCFVKVTRGNNIAFQIMDNNNNLVSDKIRVSNTYTSSNYAEVTVLSSGNTGTTSWERYRNGWVRIKWEGVIGGSNTNSYLQIYAYNHIASTGSNVGYAIWGIQVENVGCATSPILTTGSSLSRNRDQFQWYGNQQVKNSASFYDVFNKSSEFTIFTDIEYLSDQAASTTSSNAGFDLWYDSQNKFSHRRGASLLNYGNASIMNVSGSPGMVRREKIATSVRDYRTLRSKNGVLYSPTSTQANLSNSLEETYGGKYKWTRLDARVDSTDVFAHNGHLKRLIIWNDALSGDEIKELTKL